MSIFYSPSLANIAVSDVLVSAMFYLFEKRNYEKPSCRVRSKAVRRSEETWKCVGDIQHYNANSLPLLKNKNLG
jgi:hypothetical protein